MPLGLEEDEEAEADRKKKKKKKNRKTKLVKRIGGVIELVRGLSGK